MRKKEARLLSLADVVPKLQKKKAASPKIAKPERQTTEVKVIHKERTPENYLETELIGTQVFHDESRYSSTKQFVTGVIKQGEQFTDEDFLPLESSLLDPLNENGGIKEEKINYLQSLVWRRASDIYKDEHCLFTPQSSNSVKQGQIGNCYFVSALSALAKNNMQQI